MRRRLLIALAVVLGVVAVAAATAAAWLARNPVDLAFLTPLIEKEASLAGYAVEIERTQLVWHGRRGPEIRVSGTRVSTSEGVQLASFPQIGVDFSLRQLLRGRVSVTALNVDAPALHLIRQADGKVDVGLGDQEPVSSDQERAVVPLLDQLGDEPDRDSPLGMLERVRIREAHLAFEDRALGMHWRSPRADLEVWRRHGGLSGSVQAEVDLDGVPGKVGARIDWDRGGREAGVSTRLENLDLRPVLRLLLGASRAEMPSLPVTGSAKSRWRLGDSPLPVETEFELSAARRAPAGAALSGLGLEGTLREGESRPLLEVKLELERFDVARLGSYWPSGVADEPRRWVVSNITAGHVENGTLDLALRLHPTDPGRIELERLQGAFEADHLPVDYLAPLPEAQDLKTRVRFDQDRWHFEILEGHVRDVAIRSATVQIRGVSQPDTTLEVEARLEGPVTSLVGIVSMPPLEILSEYDPQQFQGQADVKLGLGLPLSSEIRPADIDLAVEADIRDAMLRDDEIRLTLSEGTLHLDSSLHRLTVRGEGLINSVPARLLWQETFEDERGLHLFDFEGELTPTDPLRPPARFEVDAVLDRSGTWHDATATVHAGDGVSRVRYAARPRRRLTADSDDLGSLLAALGSSQPIRRGILVLEGGASDPEGPFVGHFELSDFTLGETPVLGQLLDALKLKRTRALLARQGLHWDRFEGDFSAGDVVLEVRGARASGPALVLTIEGTLERKSSALDARGMVAPLDELNTLVLNVPVFGRLLTGRDEAVIAAHYRATGTLEDPDIRVDPWTTFVPGAVRDLVGKGQRLDERGDAEP